MAVLSLFLVAACGAVHSLGTPAGVIPWKPLPFAYVEVPEPTPMPYPVPTGTPACSASQVHAGWLDAQGATGRWYGGIGFAGASSDACVLDGTPVVTVFDVSHRQVNIKQQPSFGGGFTSAGPALIEPVPVPPSHATLKYGQAALTLDWDTQPEQCAGTAGVQIAAAEITIPGGGTVTVAIPPQPAAYACGGLGVSAFEAALQPIDPASIPQDPATPAVKLQAASSAAAGSNFKYVVSLTNDSKAPLDLVKNCPNYEEELFADLVHGSPPLGGKHFFQLNCRPAGTLQPGDQVDFEMVFPVPPDAAPGTYTLMFAIGYTNAMTRTLEQALTITA